VKLLRTVQWYRNLGTIYHTVVENDIEELELRTSLQTQVQDNIIERYEIKEIPLHMATDITILKGLCLTDLKKLISE